MSVPSKTKVLCVDDHELLAMGLARCMDMEEDMECVGRLSTADDLAEEAKRNGADVVLMDLEMPGRDPLESLSELRRVAPDVKVIILSGHLRDRPLHEAIAHGVDGYFLKSEQPSTILDGVRRVMHGEEAFSPAVRDRLDSMRTKGEPSTLSGLQSLTPREMEVLRLIGRGLSRAEIARQLFRSVKTIDAHHTAIMRKLDIHDRAELTRYVIQEGLVTAS